jgi:hypothetical protein
VLCVHTHIHSEIVMSTVYMGFARLLRNTVGTALVLWLFAFLVARGCALHDAYVAERVKRSDEMWLLERCSDPEFYANLRQHSTLCTEVYFQFRACVCVCVCV